MKSNAENIIVNAIRGYLQQQGIEEWRNNSGLHFCQATKRRIMLGPAGSPDIMGWLPGGRCYGIEVKRPGEYQNPNQKAFQKRMEAGGALYILARSVEDVARVMESPLADSYRLKAA